MKRASQPEAGLTLVELMVSVLISSIAISAALSMGYSMMNSYRDHKQMVLVERSARVSLDIVSDQIRNASPAVPANNIADFAGCDANMIGLSVVNSTTAPDELRVIYGAGGEVQTYLEPLAFDTDDQFFDVADSSGFSVGDVFVVSDIGNFGALMKVKALPSATQIEVAPANSLCSGTILWPGDFPQGSLLVRARMAHYAIVSDASVGNIPTLMVDDDGPDPDSEDPEPVAEGVEDMQIAIAVDTDGDGDIEEIGAVGDDDEWYYNHPDDSPLPLGTVPRALRLTIVARAVVAQEGPATYVRPKVEDRAAAGAPDEYRRRVLTTTIEIRNMAGSL